MGFFVAVTLILLASSNTKIFITGHWLVYRVSGQPGNQAWMGLASLLMRTAWCAAQPPCRWGPLPPGLCPPKSTVPALAGQATPSLNQAQTSRLSPLVSWAE